MSDVITISQPESFFGKVGNWFSSKINSRNRSQSGGRRRARTHKGGCASVGAAVLPFGLLGLQKIAQSKKYPYFGKSSTRRGTRRSSRRRRRSNLSDGTV